VTSAERVAGDGFRFRFTLEQVEEEIGARAAIGAWGRWDFLDRALDRWFQRGRRRYFGWNRDYRADTAALTGEVRLFVFTGGYCGLSRVEGGAVNLAGVISESRRRRLAPGWEAVCEHARISNPSLDKHLEPLVPGPTGFLGTGPVYFTAKPPVENGILMAGDAAGVLDPFSGQGQSAALAAGILAGEMIAKGLSEGWTTDEIAAAYAEAWKGSSDRRFQWSRILRLLMLHPTLGSLAGRVAGEHLIRFGIAATRG